jgi:hypothetical protein
MIIATKNIKDAHFKLIRKSKTWDFLANNNFYKLLTSACKECELSTKRKDKQH